MNTPAGGTVELSVLGLRAQGSGRNSRMMVMRMIRSAERGFVEAIMGILGLGCFSIVSKAVMMVSYGFQAAKRAVETWPSMPTSSCCTATATVQETFTAYIERLANHYFRSTGFASPRMPERHSNTKSFQPRTPGKHQHPSYRFCFDGDSNSCLAIVANAGLRWLLERFLIAMNIFFCMMISTYKEIMAIPRATSLHLFGIC